MAATFVQVTTSTLMIWPYTLEDRLNMIDKHASASRELKARRLVARDAPDFYAFKGPAQSGRS